MYQSRNWIALEELNLYIQVVVMTTEDEVIWKCLTVEGDGGIDDRQEDNIVGKDLQQVGAILIHQGRNGRPTTRCSLH